MPFFRFYIVPALIVTCAASYCLAQQPPADKQTLFTLTVAPPTKAREVQLRYSYSGNSGSHESSVADPTDDNKIVIKTSSTEANDAKAFELLAYAPGCQFVTISVEDLAVNRQGKFQCTMLNTVPFNGHVDVSAIGDKALRVAVLYNCDWCPQFFGQRGGALSPILLGKADVATDGSFIFDMPDFSADPLWSSIASGATLTFNAIDADTGQPFCPLRSQSGNSKKSTVPVAPIYSPVEFRLQRVIDDRIRR